MKKYRIIELSVAFAFIISAIASVGAFANECNNIRDNVIRLHILANSDSAEDQNIKLIVRDELLKSGIGMFKGEMTVENSERILKNNICELKTLINDILEENNFEYECDIYITDEYFETREYENFTMPAGRYKALKIILGEGKGHNWWCVMFPPLCLPAAKDNVNIDNVFNEKGVNIVTESDKYVFKFKIIELIEDIKIMLSSK